MNVGRPAKDSVERHGFACSPFAARIVDAVQEQVTKACGAHGLGVVPRSWYLSITANGEKVLSLWYPAKGVVEIAVPYVLASTSGKLRRLSPQFQVKKTGLHVVVPEDKEAGLRTLLPTLVAEALERARKAATAPPRPGRGRPRKVLA